MAYMQVHSSKELGSVAVLLAEMLASVEMDLQSKLSWLHKSIYLSAIWVSLSGLNVPSVSMYIAFPSPPPSVTGSCTQMQLLVRNTHTAIEHLHQVGVIRKHRVCGCLEEGIRFAARTRTHLQVHPFASITGQNTDCAA